MSALSSELTTRLRIELATALERIEAQAVEHADDPDAAKAALGRLVKSYATAQVVADGDWRPAPVAFDFDADPEAPDWVVHGLIERGTLMILSGDTGAAKSIASSALVVAAVAGERWLGHSTHIDRVMVVDEENPGRLVSGRLRALGLTNAMRDRIRYFNREGVGIGDEDRTDAWLRTELDSFRPDLLVVDTLMAACDLEDTNSNTEAVRLMKHLRALARDFGCAVLLLHHERKQSKDRPSSSGQAMMGARQWAGQADGQMTLTVETDLIEEAADDGGRKLRRTFKWRPAEKDRNGASNRPRRVAVESEKDEDGRLLWMAVRDEGAIDDGDAHDASEANILGYLRQAEAPAARKQIAAAVGERNPSEPSGTFKRALSAAVDARKVERVGQRYQLTDHARSGAPLGL